MLTPNDQCILMKAVMDAITSSTGPLTAAQEELEDSGHIWTDEHEKFALDFITFVESDGEVIL